jgi:hypothetical protein
MDAALKRILRTGAALLACFPALAASAAAQPGEYAPCPVAGDATAIGVSAASCDDARAVAAALAATPATDPATVLRSAGWTPLRAIAGDAGTSYDLIATRGRAALRIHRNGTAPDLDGWSAGRELVFSRGRLVGGGSVPAGSVLCTSSFLVSLHGHRGGLSAAHCGGLRKDGTTQRRNAAMRRPPQPGIVLGAVQRNVERSKPLDALVVPIPSGPDRPSASVIDRGALNAPWFVAGVAKPTPKRRVCFTGRTSGIDQCGQIVYGSASVANRIASRLAGTHVVCTTITAREGDSGGPVYTAPAADGSVRAVGVTTLVFGLLRTMCFTPLQPVLDALHAQLITAPA